MTDVALPLPARVAAALVAGDRRGDYRYVGQASDGSGYAVELDAARRRVYPAAAMAAWHGGFVLGQQLAGQKRRRRGVRDRKRLADIRTLLVAPTLADQCRLAVHAAREDAGLTVSALAERIGRTRHAVADALALGRSGALSMTMAEQMMAGTGRHWDVRYYLPDVDEATAPAISGGRGLVCPAGPAGLVRMRALVLVDEAGLIVWQPPAPNEALRARTYSVEVAGGEVTKRAEVLVPWLVGIADAADPRLAAALTA